MHCMHRRLENSILHIRQRLSCSVSAGLTVEKVALPLFREGCAAHVSRQKTDFTTFASADAKLCEAFFDRMSGRERAVQSLPVSHFKWLKFYFLLIAPGCCDRIYNNLKPAPAQQEHALLTGGETPVHLQGLCKRPGKYYPDYKTIKKERYQ